MEWRSLTVTDGEKRRMPAADDETFNPLPSRAYPGGGAEETRRMTTPEWCAVGDAMLRACFSEPLHPAGGALAESFPLPGNRACFLVGHGVRARRLPALQSFLRTAFAAPTPEQLRPERMLDMLNAFFFDELKAANYMTCLAAVLDFNKNQLVYHSAGHPDVLRCSAAEGSVRSCDPERRAGGIPVGWRRDFRYRAEENVTVHFDDDDLFLFHTDGIQELSDPETGKSAGEKLCFALLGMLAREEDPVILPARFRTALDQLGFTRQRDDLLLLAVRKSRQEPDVFRRVIAPNFSEAARLAEACAAQMTAATRDHAFATRLALLLSEFLNNAIQHGFAARGGSRNSIAVRVRLTEHHAVVEIADRGVHWRGDPEDPPPCDILERVNTSGGTSGRGVAIIREIASAIRRNRYRDVNQTIFQIPLTRKEIRP